MQISHMNSTRVRVCNVRHPCDSHCIPSYRVIAEHQLNSYNYYKKHIINSLACCKAGLIYLTRT